MFLFEEIVVPPLMTVVDVGAMLLDEADPYARLNALGRLNVIGFEPQPAECAKLNALSLPGRHYLPYVIADGKRRSFYQTNTGMTSSLLPPNLQFAQLFNNLAELMQVVATGQVNTIRLDDVAEVRAQGCDLLKLDTQGSEAEILAHASETLKNCLIVHTEVEFVQLYEGQPLFAEVDQLLRGHGFMFHRFHGHRGAHLQAADDAQRSQRDYEPGIVVGCSLRSRPGSPGPARTRSAREVGGLAARDLPIVRSMPPGAGGTR